MRVWHSIRSLLLICFLLMSCMFVQKVFANELFYGTGEPNDPFQIATAEQLCSIGADPNLLDKYFVLVADIDLDPNLPGGKVFTQALIASTAHITPSTADPCFVGSFDGHGYTLDHLTIESVWNWRVGLFGWIGSQGVVKDLYLKNVMINSHGARVGGLAGENWGSVANCHVTGNVAGREAVGGLIGQNGHYLGETMDCGASTATVMQPDESLVGVISGCSADANVTPSEKDYFGGGMGGLVGANSGRLVEGCWSQGRVSGRGWVGGLLGYHEAGRVINCYSQVQVQGLSGVGGLIGANDSGVMLCYAAGRVAGIDHVGGLIGRGEGSAYLSYFDKQMSDCNVSAGGQGLRTDRMMDTLTYRGWGYEARWTLQTGIDYPRLAWEQRDGILLLDASGIYAGGSGDPNDPYQIATAEQLWALETCWPDFDHHFVQINDIDFNEIDANLINPIGALALPFSGTYDGNGFALSGYCDDRPMENDIGLFGCVAAGGRIANLWLRNIEVRGCEGVGALVGHLHGTVLNCGVDGLVRGEDDVGGLVGLSTAGAEITACYANTRIYGGSVCGGLVGDNQDAFIVGCSSDSAVGGKLVIGGLAGGNSGTIIYCDANAVVNASLEASGGLVGNNFGQIQYCSSQGQVWGHGAAGGLVGFNSVALTTCEDPIRYFIGEIFDSYSRARVGGDTRIGGLVGENWGVVTRCYAAGRVNGLEKTGGLIGERYATDPYPAATYNSYWDVETSGQSESAGGQGRTTEQMQQQDTFAGWDFDVIWDVVENQAYPFLRKEHIYDFEL